MATLYLIFEVLTNHFKWLYHFTAIISTIYEDAFSPHPLQHLLLSTFPYIHISNLRNEDNTTLMAENEEELKSLLINEKKESEKAGLRVNIPKH